MREYTCGACLNTDAKKMGYSKCHLLLTKSDMLPSNCPFDDKMNPFWILSKGNKVVTNKKDKEHR